MQNDHAGAPLYTFKNSTIWEAAVVHAIDRKAPEQSTEGVLLTGADIAIELMYLV